MDIFYKLYDLHPVLLGIIYNIPVYYTCVLYLCIIPVYYTCVLYLCIIPVYTVRSISVLLAFL